jgi:hypothetical protein
VCICVHLWFPFLRPTRRPPPPSSCRDQAHFWNRSSRAPWHRTDARKDTASLHSAGATKAQPSATTKARIAPEPLRVGVTPHRATGKATAKHTKNANARCSDMASSPALAMQAHRLRALRALRFPLLRCDRAPAIPPRSKPPAETARHAPSMEKSPRAAVTCNAGSTEHHQGHTNNHQETPESATREAQQSSQLHFLSGPRCDLGASP